MRLELHCHTTCSDGAEAPAALGARARDRELALLCVTDHDTTAGTDEAAAAFGGATLRGVEVSCTEDGRTVHVLCYDAAGGDGWREVETLLAAQATARKQRVETIGAQLRIRFGLAVDVTPILAEAERRSVGRPDVAALLVAQGLVPDRDAAFTKYLYDGGPGDPPHRRLGIGELLERVRAAGGRAALAHPHLYGDRGVRWLERHRAGGLDGVEAYYGHYEPAERDRWLNVAKRLDLTPCGGSDWHGPGTARDVGVDLPDPAAERILAWLGRV